MKRPAASASWLLPIIGLVGVTTAELVISGLAPSLADDLKTSPPLVNSSPDRRLASWARSF